MRTFVFLLLLASLPLQAEDLITIQLAENVELLLKRDTFDPKDREIEYWENSREAISRIGGWLVYGTDAMMPDYELVYAAIRIDGDLIELETKGMYDPWVGGETPDSVSRYEKYLGNPHKVRMLFSVACARYEVEWQILNGKSYRTVIQQVLGNDI